MKNNKWKQIAIVISIICLLVIAGSITTYFLYLLPKQEMAKLEMMKAEKEQALNITKNTKFVAFKGDCEKDLNTVWDHENEVLDKAVNEEGRCNGLAGPSLQSCFDELQKALFPDHIQFSGSVDKEKYLNNCAQTKLDQIF